MITVVQEQPLGTADALRAAEAHIDPDAAIVVLNGDVPLIRAETIDGARAGAGACRRRGDDADRGARRPERLRPRRPRRRRHASNGSSRPSGPSDATAEELQIHEINTGIYAFAGAALLPALARVGNDNAQGEYYLPDVLPILRARARLVTALELDDAEETLGDQRPRAARARCTAIAQRRINDDAHARRRDDRRSRRRP